MFFFFNDTATTEIYTLSLHDALPIFTLRQRSHVQRDLERHLRAIHRRGDSERRRGPRHTSPAAAAGRGVEPLRSEEHTSELQSQSNLVCRLLLAKKNSPTQPPSCMRC